MDNKSIIDENECQEKEVICTLSDLYLQDLAYFAENDPEVFKHVGALFAEMPGKTVSFYNMQPTMLFRMFNHMTSKLSFDQGYIVVVHGSRKTVQNILNRIEELHKMVRFTQKIISKEN